MSTNFEEEEFSLSDWISQAEAARLHEVSRQAIHKLVQSGRLKSKIIGGHILVSRSDLEEFRPQKAGRPKADTSRAVERIKRLLDTCSPEDRQDVFQRLRSEITIHPLETTLGIPAEVILESISRSGDLTIRMIRGVIAESAFDRFVVKKLTDWENLPFSGDQSYDFLLKQTNHDPVKVQVKLQRSRNGVPFLSDRVPKKYGFGGGMFVVETQRTRGGKNQTTGESTRPYRFGEFDILAIATYPSTGKWDSFVYTVSNWLIPKMGQPGLLETYQPVSASPNEDWTDDFETCVEWLRSGRSKTIGVTPRLEQIEGDSPTY